MSSETLDIKPAKVYQGSAVYDAFGGCIFTPYDSNPKENTPWTVLAVTDNGKISCTKKVIKLEVTFTRTDASILVAKFNRQIAALLTIFLKPKVLKMYKEAANGKKISPLTPEGGSHPEQVNDDGLQTSEEAEELAKQEEERPFGYDVTNT